MHRYRDLTAAYDFSGVRRLVDVGAGQGGLTSILLAAIPTLRSVLLDLPEVIADARTRLEAEGLASRCEFVPGSFFDAVPRGGDLYLLANVLNNWRDRDAERILHACREAMTKGTTLLFIDALYAPPSQRKQAPPCWAPGVSLMTTATRGGGSRDESQWRTLLRSAGFDLKSIRPLAQNHLFEALPI